MKTVERTATRLVLEHRPVALALGLFALSLTTLAFAIVLFARGNDAGVIFLCFALSPPVFAYFFLETRRIIFEREPDAVTLEYRAPRGRRGATHPLAEDARVTVQRAGPTPEARTVPEEGAPGVPTRAVLVTENGKEIPLSESYSKGPEAYQVREAVTAWLSAETA